MSNHNIRFYGQIRFLVAKSALCGVMNNGYLRELAGIVRFLSIYDIC